MHEHFFDKIIMVSGIGSVIGTVIRFIQKPSLGWRRALLESTVAITVGTLAGGVSHEYFQFGPWVTSSAAAVGAYLSDSILRSLEVYVKRYEWDRKSQSWRSMDDITPGGDLEDP